MKTIRRRGSILLLVLVFGAIFFSVLTAISGYVLLENRAEELQRQKQESFAISEAGLEYYRWFLSHFPGDTQNGTGQPGPYQVSYLDPQGGAAGTYTLSITGNAACGQKSSIDVTSKGVPSDAPTVSKTLWARYAQPSVAQYSFIVNSSVWVGSTLFGPFHSNGGIRMDGTSTSPVTSSLATWTCDANFGCAPSAVKPGVFGAGVDQSLWQYPTPQTDFGAISADFSALKTTAQATGLYFARTSSGNGGNAYFKGYHLIFNSNGTVTVYRVGSENTVSAVPVSNPGAGLQTEYTLIQNEVLDGTYAIPSGCPLIYVEDHTWVEGTISGKVTLADADVAHAGVVPYTLLKNNIVYSVFDGSAGFTLVSQGDVLIAPDAPSNLTLDGIFISQSGAFGMNMYTCANAAYANKNTLTILGTIVSNLKPGTYWTYSGYGCGNGKHSGYPTRTTTFDRQNSTNPPVFTPITSTQYQFVDWREQ
jgi:hypothetical protein